MNHQTTAVAEQVTAAASTPEDTDLAHRLVTAIASNQAVIPDEDDALEWERIRSDAAAAQTVLEHTRDQEHDTRELISIAFTEVLADEERVDKKAVTLLSVFGVITAAALGFASKNSLSIAATITLWIATGPMLTALAQLLLVVRPNVTGAPFLRYALHTTQMVSDEFRRDSAMFIDHRINRLQKRSAVNIRKYRGVRRAVHWMLLGATGLVCALVLAWLG
ncbi:MAG: Pycsar system effector family protein [Kibdelosporangium sp.]